MKRIAVVALLACMANGAHGQTAGDMLYSGRDFLGHCEQMQRLDNMPRGSVLDPDNMLRVGICMGYIKGLVNGLEVGDGKVARGIAATAICAPAGETVGKFTRVAIAALQANNSELDRPAAPFLIRTFRTYYPCQKRKSP